MPTALYFATQSDIRLSASCGKYNITLTISQNITFRLALKISLFAMQTISLYLKNDCGVIRKMLISSCKTLKEKKNGTRLTKSRVFFCHEKILDKTFCTCYNNYAKSIS